MTERPKLKGLIMESYSRMGNDRKRSFLLDESLRAEYWSFKQHEDIGTIRLESSASRKKLEEPTSGSC